MYQRLQREARMQRMQSFEENYRAYSLKVAKEQARMDAMQKSGYLKLRAKNRELQLDSSLNSPPGSFFDRLGEYVRKNQHRRAENLRKTAEKRKTAEQIKRQRLKNGTKVVPFQKKR